MQPFSAKTARKPPAPHCKWLHCAFGAFQRVLATPRLRPYVGHTTKRPSLRKEPLEPSCGRHALIPHGLYRTVSCCCTVPRTPTRARPRDSPKWATLRSDWLECRTGRRRDGVPFAESAGTTRRQERVCHPFAPPSPLSEQLPPHPEPSPESSRAAAARTGSSIPRFPATRRDFACLGFRKYR